MYTPALKQRTTNIYSGPIYYETDQKYIFNYQYNHNCVTRIMNPFDIMGRLQLRIFLLGIYLWLLFAVLVLAIYYLRYDLLFADEGSVFAISLIYVIFSLFQHLLTTITANYTIEISTEQEGWNEFEQRKSLVLEGFQHILFLTALVLVHSGQVEAGIVIEYLATICCIVAKFTYLFTLFNIRTYPSISNKWMIIGIYTVMSIVIISDCIAFVVFFI
jgi:hypothetical protein